MEAHLSALQPVPRLQREQVKVACGDIFRIGDVNLKQIIRLAQAKSEWLHEESCRSYGKNQLDPVRSSDLSHWPKLRADIMFP